MSAEELLLPLAENELCFLDDMPTLSALPWEERERFCLPWEMMVGWDDLGFVC